MVVFGRGLLGGGQEAGDEVGLIQAARDVFTSSMSTPFTISAIKVLAAAVLAALVMRDTRPEPGAESGTAAAPAEEEPGLVA